MEEIKSIGNQAENSALPIGYVDDAQISAWKTQYQQKNIAEIETTDEDGGKHVTYFKKPTLDLLQMVATYDKKDDAVQGIKVMFNTLRIGGSEEVLTDDEMKMSAMRKVAGLFKVKEAVLKKR